jgi:hypothetical protein
MRPLAGLGGSLVLAAALAGCDSFSSGNPAQNQLDAAELRWANAGYVSYEYKLRRLCFCAPEHTHTLRVRVESGQVTSVFDLDTNLPATSTSLGFTVPQLFAIIQDALDRRAFRLAVEYEETLGYPSAIGVDYDDGTADDEITYLASELAQIP